jgi:hypothetical protein
MSACCRQLIGRIARDFHLDETDMMFEYLGECSGEHEDIRVTIHRKATDDDDDGEEESEKESIKLPKKNEPPKKERKVKQDDTLIKVSSFTVMDGNRRKKYLVDDNFNVYTHNKRKPEVVGFMNPDRTIELYPKDA